MPIAKVLRSGNSQAVRLPRQFRTEVEIFRRGNEIVLGEKSSNIRRAFDLLRGLPDDFTVPGHENTRRKKRKGL